MQVADNVWTIAGLYDFVGFAADGTPTPRAARFQFVIVREGTQCKIAAFNSSWVPSPGRYTPLLPRLHHPDPADVACVPRVKGARYQ